MTDALRARVLMTLRRTAASLLAPFSSAVHYRIRKLPAITALTHILANAFRSPVVDCLVLVTVVALSAVTYVGGLGFYGDDWGYFSEATLSDDSSLSGVIAELYSRDVGLPQRPVQLAYVGTMYYVFGLDPLGYHVVGVVLLGIIALLFYGVLRGLAQPRAFAVAIPLVYVLLPNYVAARLWFAAHTAALSVLFLLLSSYATLRALRSRSPWFLAWLVLAAGAVAASGLAYELTVPVFVSVLILISIRQAQIARVDLRSFLSSRKVIAVLGAHAVALAFVISYKAYITTRIGIDETYLEYVARVVRGTLQVNFGAYGIGLPYILSWIVRHAPSAEVFGVAGVIFAIVSMYLYRLAPSVSKEARALLVRYIACGLALFVAGYAIFIVPTLIAFESAGRETRIGVAATLGVAFIYVGLLGTVASLFSQVKYARLAFSTSIGILCAVAVIITNTQGRFWEDAYEKQREIEGRIKSDVGPVPPGGVLILDGVCLQGRGAYVLTGARDLTGILRIEYGSEQVRGDAVIRPVRIDSDGISLKAFNAVAFYPYGENLILYNVRRRATYRLRSEAAARNYFVGREFRPERDCPTAFAWGLERA